MIYLYRDSLNAAKADGYESEYNASLQANIECMKAIDDAIGEHFDGMHLDPKGAKKVLAEFGYDRTMWVLAASVKGKPHDGRFSPDTRKWANSIIPQHISKSEFAKYASDAHPAVLDGFIGQVRKEYAKLGLLSSKECVPHKSDQSYEKQLLILCPEMLKEQYRTPHLQYFYAESGFGCYPDKLGGKVFGRFLADGERTHFRRNDFIGIADRDKLPGWAARRLEVFEASKMKIRIFQIDGEKDTQLVRFMHYDFTMKHGGVDPSTYRQAYGGTIKAESLENIFMLCNTDQFPPGFCGRSLSVSDVIEVCEGKDRGFYFCDKIGFKKLEDFDIEKTDHAEMMKILVLENDREPYTAEIRNELHAMQSVVGGLVRPLYFESDDNAVCWYNDDYLSNGSTPNRRIGNALVNGACYIAGDRTNKYGERESCSLTDEQIQKYTQMFPQSVVVLDEDNSEDFTEGEDIDQTLS